MKRLYVALIMIIALAGMMAVSTVSAQDATEPPMTDDHISRIKNNCQPTLATLAQIRTNDGPVFVNRNQAYFSISDKLMTRLNNRLTVGKFDVAALVRIDNDFNTALADFRTTFKRYNDTMAELVRMNCTQQPSGFYNKVAEARKLREEAHSVVLRLHGEIEKYRQAVATFKTENESRLKGGSNE